MQDQLSPSLIFPVSRSVAPLSAADNWAMLPSAGGFVDPLLSTGFPLTLLGVARLAYIIEKDWDTSQLPARLERYAAATEAELLAAARLIAALYANMHDFPVFSALSLLYFTAVSYTETARRLGKPHLAGAFLMHDHPVFGVAMRSSARTSATASLRSRIHATDRRHSQGDRAIQHRRLW